MDRDVTSLMIPLFSGGVRDEFGREKDAMRPLLLDQIMEHRSRASDSSLLSLPTEILADIVDAMAQDQQSLAALALVNSDCRQLARSCQFADVCFDYSPRALDLLHALLQEAFCRLNNAVVQPTIGACIRRASVKTHPGWVAGRHRELYESIFGDRDESITQEERNELKAQATKQYIEMYRDPVAVATCASMPHLETIVWEDRMSVDANFFRFISHSPVRHLKLLRLTIQDPYLMEPPLTPEVMPIRSLSLDVRLAWGDSDGNEPQDGSMAGGATTPTAGRISPFYESLFRRCAPTLESLVWSFIAIGGNEPLSFSDEPIFFPRLRCLHLPTFDTGPSVLSAFLGAPLRQLALPVPSEDAMRGILADCEPLRDLQTLTIPSLNDSNAAKSLIHFLGKHPYIHSLCIEKSAIEVLDLQIIPLLSPDKFSYLQSLSLSWGGPGIKQETKLRIATIVEESLAVIGTLTTLEQLQLSAGEVFGWRCQWLVDHEELRRNLMGLTKLKKLALCRDTYRLYSATQVEGYYEERYVLQDERRDARARPELDDEDMSGNFDGDSDWELTDQDKENTIWERAHRNRMLDQAEKYAAVFPSLEWIYCGQLLMAIDKAGTRAFRAAFPLTKERDTCYTLLKRMFKVGEE